MSKSIGSVAPRKPTKSAKKPAKNTVQKPAKPRADFPLFPHACGRWAKTIRGNTHYFGRWNDPHGAEAEYLEVAEDLHAGRVPKPKKADGPTLRSICNAFLTAKRTKLDAGKLSPRSFVDYTITARILTEEFEPDRPVSDFGPADFEKLYGKLSKRFSAASLRAEIVQIKGVFKHAFENDLIDRPVKFGTVFCVPTAADLRREKQKKKKELGGRNFTAAQIRALLKKAPVQLKAMILLGLNCGFGNTDLANLPRSAINLETGWVDYPRQKTSVERRCPLWPETLQAIRDVLAKRKEPSDPADADIVFVTKFLQKWVRYSLDERIHFGKKIIRPKQDDGIAKAMDKLLKELKLKRPGLSFYSLRHTFETEAGDSRDQVVVDLIMGHSDPKMSEAYRQEIKDWRFKAVTDHVRAWLFPQK